MEAMPIHRKIKIAMPIHRKIKIGFHQNPAEYAELRNGLHGSDSPASAEREIEIVFPHILHGSTETDDGAAAG